MSRLTKSLVLALLVVAACTDGRAGNEGKTGAFALTKPDGKTHTNRLAKELSPYLLQHATNPVDWFPWGEEAFAKAKKEDKPIFLSIGYATCHWCHVMERESFENEETAAYLNEHFVSIKVDREERPDIDNVYMAAVQAMTGSGGWPLSVFLTPAGRPFWGGTYFPPEDRYGRPGFRTVLSSIAKAWREKRHEILTQGDRLTDHLNALARQSGAAELDIETLRTAAKQLSGTFDETHGGFGPAPKFPRTHLLSLLLRLATRGEAPEATAMVESTLTRMARGGIHDHLGGGFHRYSTDPVWLVPHFEKMLYDQALIARAAVETFQVTGKARYAEIARDVYRYVLRDMTDPAGGFYSAEDADSEGVEGKFYVWTRREILTALGEEEGGFLADIYGVTEKGNFPEEATGEVTGANILHLSRDLKPAEEKRLAPLRQTLFRLREGRVHPLKDDKVLADWNGLMIASMAYAGRSLPDESLTAAAAKAADFVLEEMTEDGRLLHRWRAGRASIPAFLDDHAFLALGLFELYQSTLDPKWLVEAKRILAEMVDRFEDPGAGGFFFTAAKEGALVSRSKEVYDGAIPSGNSVAALVLLTVGRLTMDERLTAAGRKTLACFSAHLAKMPTGFPVLLTALDFDLGPAREITLAGKPGTEAFQALAREVRRRFLPRTVVAGSGAEGAPALIPFLAEQGPVDGRPAAYVCVNYACKRPVTTPKALEKLLE